MSEVIRVPSLLVDPENLEEVITAHTTPENTYRGQKNFDKGDYVYFLVKNTK